MFPGSFAPGLRRPPRSTARRSAGPITDANATGASQDAPACIGIQRPSDGCLAAQVGQDGEDPAVVVGGGRQTELGEHVPDVGLHGLG